MAAAEFGLRAGGAVVTAIPVASIHSFAHALLGKHEVACAVRKKIAFVAGCLTALLFLVGGAGRASAQQCPRLSGGTNRPSHIRPLQGRLIYHNGIRQWFELRLDRPQCGERAIQLVQPDNGPKRIEIFRGCRIRSSGPVDFTLTGYFSLSLYQQVRSITPDGACLRQKPFHDFSEVTPDPHVRSYSVNMHVDYRRGDHPILFRVRSGGRALRPWQAYADYWLTGSFVLYGLCGDGFVVDRVHGPPEARPSHFDNPREPGDMATYDPENAGVAGKMIFDARYSCVRASR